MVTGYPLSSCGQVESISTDTGLVLYLIAMFRWDRRFCSIWCSTLAKHLSDQVKSDATCHGAGLLFLTLLQYRFADSAQFLDLVLHDLFPHNAGAIFARPPDRNLLEPP